MELMDVFITLAIVTITLWIFSVVLRETNGEIDTMKERGRIACNECEGIYKNCTDDSMTYSCVVEYRERHNLTEEEYSYYLDTKI